MRFRIGHGYDSHRFAEGRRLVMGGVDIPHGHGLLGHSDADVLTHAVIDAILGAAGLGDIGTHFPDTDPAYKDANSMKLLSYTINLVRESGYRVEWVDATVICEAPRIGPHREAISKRMAGAGLGGFNLKGKSNEGMGFTGRGEGIAVFAVCLLRGEEV